MCLGFTLEEFYSCLIIHPCLVIHNFPLSIIIETLANQSFAALTSLLKNKEHDRLGIQCVPQAATTVLTKALEPLHINVASPCRASPLVQVLQIT